MTGILTDGEVPTSENALISLRPARNGRATLRR